ncbi:MAG TPA: Na+/H+ antiporter NhaA [bacterium]|nr:Na+/H+ antiporter NhaA [bacterium]
MQAIREFLRLESAGGIVLVVAALVSLTWANTPLAPYYQALLSAPVMVQVGALVLDKPLLLWINDGLMAVFFFLVGLEIKREICAGELSRPARVVYPALAAIGGMAVPAAIYVWLNQADPVALNGWAIPAATDIAFALGVLSLFGRRVPTALKMFLLAVAVIDDLGAIVVIALFYAGQLSIPALAGAALALVALLALNMLGVSRTAPYVLLGVVLWVLVLKSGVHATLAGVATALIIPHRVPSSHPGQPEARPGEHLEHALHPWVAFGILPLFALANAGVPLAGFSLERLLAPLPLGIALGLLVGKQAGVLGACALASAVGLSKPDGVTWGALYGAAVLCGIGFTMSLFVSSLAFEGAGFAYGVDTRIGILVGSLLSAALGGALLHAFLPRRPAPEPYGQ